MSKFVMAVGRAFLNRTGSTKKMGRYLKICNAVEIPEGNSKVFENNDMEIVVVHVEGSFYALDNRCSHKKGPLSLGQVLGQTVICPWHGARFDLQSGRLFEGPNCKSLKSYTIKLNQDKTGCPTLFFDSWLDD